MCQGNIIKVSHTDIPIEAYKQVYTWGYTTRREMDEMCTTEDWYLAALRIIVKGGKGGLQLGDCYNTSHLAPNYWLNDDDKIEILPEARLSGWHAYLKPPEFSPTYYNPFGEFKEPVYKVWLRGFIQISDQGEISGSEMRVLKRLRDEERE